MCWRSNIGGLAAGWALFAPTPLLAQYVSPMVYDLTPSGKDAAREIEFWNTQALTAAIEVTVSRRTYDEDGKAHDSPAPDAFKVVPSQFLIASGKRQKVRVRYSGPSTIPASATYAISFRQVPIPNPGDATRLRTIVDFISLANVVPPGADPDISVESARVVDTFAEVTFINRGKSYGRLDSNPLQISDEIRTVHFSRDELRDQYDLRWILPGSKRIVVLPLRAPLSGGVKAAFLSGSGDGR